MRKSEIKFSTLRRSQLSFPVLFRGVRAIQKKQKKTAEKMKKKRPENKTDKPKTKRKSA
jgi:hypothetical protein